MESIEAGLMADAQRFIVLGQTDSLWKEHLQARSSVSLTAHARCASLLCRLHEPSTHCTAHRLPACSQHC